MRISDWSSDVCSSDLPSRFRLRINVKADNRIFVSGMGLESEWKSNVQVRGTTASPRLSGTLEVVRGTYSFASKRFDVDHGIVRSEEHKSELQSLMRISYAVFCLKKKKAINHLTH